MQTHLHHIGSLKSCSFAFVCSECAFAFYQIGEGGLSASRIFEKSGGHGISIGKGRLFWEVYVLKYWGKCAETFW